MKYRKVLQRKRALVVLKARVIMIPMTLLVLPAVDFRSEVTIGVRPTSGCW